MDDLFVQTTNQYMQVLEEYPDSKNLAWLLGPKSSFFMEGIYESVECVTKWCPPGSQVIDFGCATGLFTAQLQARGIQAFGLDIVVHETGVETIWQAWRSLQPLVGARFSFYDGKHIPFADNSVDGIVAHAVLEHIPSDNLSFTLTELYRIIRPGGFLFIFSTPRPQSYAEWIVGSSIGKRMGLHGHELLLHERDLQNDLQMIGFNIREIKRTDLIIAQLPGRFQNILNLFTPITLKLDRLLLNTPLSWFAHHSWIVSSKGKDN